VGAQQDTATNTTTGNRVSLGALACARRPGRARGAREAGMQPRAAPHVAGTAFLKSPVRPRAGQAVGVCAQQGGAMLPPQGAVPVPTAYFPFSNYSTASWPVPQWCAGDGEGSVRF